MFFIDNFPLPVYNGRKGVTNMKTNLIAAILGGGLALFNLYFFFQRGTGTYLILFIVWLLVAFKNYKQYKAKKD